MPNRRNVLIFIMSFLLVLSCSREAQNQTQPREQLHFSAEDSGVEKSAAIPPDVWLILTKDSTVQSALADNSLTDDQLPVSWFSASEVSLESKAKEDDFVVMGLKSLRGANITQFWVFMQTQTGHKLVMNSAAHDLILEPDPGRRFKIVKLVSITAVEISTTWLHFDGALYQDYRHAVRKID